MTYRAPPTLGIFDEMLRLTRGLSGLRLAIADGFDRLEALGGVEALGYPRGDAYARERLGRSGRWLGDARTLGRRLAALPRLREAYLSGRLSTSKVELLARTLSRAGERDREEELMALARTATVRELRARLRLGGEDDGESRPRRVVLTRHVARVDAVAFEGAVVLMGALGETTRSAAIEGLLAEGLTTLLNGAELAPELVSAIAGRLPGWDDETRAVGERGQASGGQVPSVEDEAAQQPVGMAMVPPYIDASVATVEGLDGALRDLSAELTRRDLRLGELMLEAESRGRGWSHGHRSAEESLCDALGMAPSSLAARVALARRVERLAGLKAALIGGRIGFESATLLARVASAENEAEWLALAERTTTKVFREHVDAAELHARVDGRRLDRLGPPPPTQLEEARELERRVLGMVLSGPGGGDEAASPMSVYASEPEPVDPEPVDPEPELGRVPLRLTFTEDLARLWCQLELLHADAGSPAGSFVAFLVAATLATWRGSHRAVAYGDIYLRDRYRCQSPVCRSRHVTPHHIVFRSRGGGDEAWNLVGLCDRCHLTLVHGGHLAVTGLAPHALTWASRGFVVSGT